MELFEYILLAAGVVMVVGMLSTWISTRYDFGAPIFICWVPILQLVVLGMQLHDVRKMYKKVPKFLRKTVKLMLKNKDYQVTDSKELFNKQLGIRITRDGVCFQSREYLTRIYRPIWIKEFPEKKEIDKAEAIYNMYKESLTTKKKEKNA